MSVPERAGDPGGTGAVLGARLLRYAGVQGLSLVLSNVLQLASVAVVANFLGPADLGQYALLLFLAGVVTQIFVVVSKAGTIRRVFGGGDDDDDDEEGEEMVSTSPPRSLGVGILWALFLGFSGAGLMIAFKDSLANLLLGSTENSIYVVWAAITVAFWTAAKLTAIVIWLERRPTAFIIADASRPIIALIALIILLASGAGVEGSIASLAIGVFGATLVGIFLLRDSLQFAIDPRETWEIAKQGRRRAPIVFPFWIIQNADVFLLSRFVSDFDLGIYTLASRLGFVVSFLPQGFRMAMRPLRKSAIFQAVRDEYGQATQKGQLLAYFTLLCIFAVMAMVLLGEILVEVAPPEYSGAASLIPFTAAALVMPALYRTVNQNVILPNGRQAFVMGCLMAMVMFVGLTALLAPEIGSYAAPISMFASFAMPAIYMFVRCQAGSRPIRFPYGAVSRAFVLAVAVAGGFIALPALGKFADLGIALALMVAYLGLLIVFRVIPEHHWQPLVTTARATIRGSTIRNFDPRAGILVLPEGERKDLRRAVKQRVPEERLRHEGHGRDLVSSLRTAGTAAGVPGIDEPTEKDEEIAVFLFELAPTAVRNASMRRLLDDEVPSDELRSLEDLVAHLSRVPNDAWRPDKRRTGRGGASPTSERSRSGQAQP